MTKPSQHSGKTPPDPRKARLAEALRDNLRRRKEQARERKEERRSADSGEAGSETGAGAGKDRRS